MCLKRISFTSVRHSRALPSFSRPPFIPAQAGIQASRRRSILQWRGCTDSRLRGNNNMAACQIVGTRLPGIPSQDDCKVGSFSILSESWFTGLKDDHGWGPSAKSQNQTNHSSDKDFAIVLDIERRLIANHRGRAIILQTHLLARWASRIPNS